MSTRWLSSARIAGLLAGLLFALALALGALAAWLRAGLREQVLRREGTTLQAVTTMQRAIESERLSEIGLGGEDEELALMILQAARLEGVLAVQVFDAAGRALDRVLTPFPLAPPSPAEWERLRRGEPVTRFTVDWRGVAPEAARHGPFPLLEVCVPVPGGTGNGPMRAARFMLDGERVAREFAQLDRRLAIQAGVVWTGTALLIAAGAGWTLARLRRAQAALESRTRELTQANRELAFAAKSSALGAVAAHLVHGLRNPLAGLEQLLRDGGRNDASKGGLETAQRMRDMVNEVVTLLHEERTGVRYEVGARELLEGVASRVAALATARGVTVRVEGGEHGPTLSNREAGLVAAILANLLRNACEAAPSRTGEVRLGVRGGGAGHAWEFFVHDNGPGMPARGDDRWFEPGRSTKPGGAGIGLAICRQLAIHLRADLQLARSRPGETEFRLRLPTPEPAP